MAVKTAEEVLASIRSHERGIEKQKRQRTALEEQNRREMERLEFYEDIRDDVMSCVRNSGMTFEEIHGHCGPHPQTLENWAQQKTRKPQLGKLRSTLRIIGKDFAIVDLAKNDLH
jgi:hypothetical protein